MHLAETKRRTRLELDKHEKRILILLDVCSRSRRIAEKEKSFSHLVPLLNAVQYTIIADLDLSFLTYQMMIAESDWERKLSARILAMTLVECVEDTAQILGKNFRIAADAIFNESEHFQKIDLIRRKIAMFRRKHEGMLRELRNIAAAHRDKDGDLQLVAIKNTNVKVIWRLSMEFTRLLGQFDELVIQIFAHRLNL